MTDFNLVGIDLVTGQFRPVGPNDTSTDSSENQLSGFTGLSGVTGLPGLAPSVEGSAGNTGVRGITGFAPTGLFGETGIVGATGVAGRTGLRGITGPAEGVRGLTGISPPGLDSSGPYSVLFGATTITLGANIVGVTGGGFAVTLPAVPFGKRYLFYDISGVASSVPWSITGGSIQGLSGYTVIQDYELVELFGGAGFWYLKVNQQGNTGLSGTTGIAGATGIQANTGIQGQTGI